MDATKTRNVTANLPLEVAHALEELVKQSRVTRSQYIGFLIQEAVAKKRVFKVTKSVQVVEI